MAVSFKFEWKKGADVPCGITWCVTTSAGESTYVADYSNGLKVFSYDPKSDAWEFLSEKHSPPTVFFGMAGFRGNLVFVGGKDVQTSEPSHLVTEWMHDEKRYSNPYPPMLCRRVDPLVVGSGDYLIVMGGTVGEQSVEVFNAGENAFMWQKAGCLPVSTLLSCAVIKEVLYLLGDSNQLYKISLPHLVSSPDPVWELVTETPYKESTVFSYQDHLLIAGGYISSPSDDDELSSTPVADVMRLNEDIKWVKVEKLPQPLIRCCCIEVPKHKGIFVMAGRSTKDSQLLTKGVYATFDD